jgi:PBSX family phage portal protein
MPRGTPKEEIVEGGRVWKARYIGPEGTQDTPDAASRQLVDDPFVNITGYGDTVSRPPYALEQLVFLAESQPLHGSSLEQKAIDVIGDGPLLLPKKEGDDAAVGDKDAYEQWMDDLTEQQTLVELLQATWLDYETTGFGFIEVARDIEGIVRHIYHVPSHTMRAHRDGKRYIQIRQGRMAWFKRWGVTYEDADGQTIPIEKVPLLTANGRRAVDGTSFDKLANEVLVFVKSSRRSTWYGIPNYISAIGDIAMSLAARDYNIKFFNNAREPRYIMVITGLANNVDEMIDNLTSELTTQHNEPHRNLVLPLSGGAEVKIERLTAVANDQHFTKMMEACARNILIAHRMPPDRLGSVLRGMLGGNVAENINRIYKDAVVSPAQVVLEDRWGRFSAIEYARTNGRAEDAALAAKDIPWKIGFERLDVEDEAGTVDTVVAEVKANLITLNEGRAELGLSTDDPRFDVTLAELLSKYGGAAAVQASLMGPTAKARPQGDVQAAVLARMDQMDDVINDLLMNEPDPVSAEPVAA